MKIYRYLIILFSSLVLMLVLPSLLPTLMTSANGSPEIALTSLFDPVLSLEGTDDYTSTVDSPSSDLGGEATEVNQSGYSYSSITGRVTNTTNSPISGVVISTNTGLTTTTDANGNYTLSNLLSGSYTFTPTKSGCTFSPASRTVSVPPNATGQNFTGTCAASTYSITGRVTDTTNSPISGVVISTNTGLTATTDANGNYTLTNLQPRSYTLTPTRTSCTFSPASRTVSVPPNATGQNFTGTCTSPANKGTLVGIIYHARTGQRIAGANVTAVCTGAKLVTDARGYYRFDNLPVGLCRVTATRAGYKDGFRDGQVIAGEIRWNSVALEPISAHVGTLIGIIYDTKTGQRLAEATVTACTGEIVKSDFYGFYRFINLPAGTCRVTASKSGYQNNFRDGLVIANAVRWNSIGLQRLLATSAEASSDATTLTDGGVAGGGTITIFDLAFLASHYGSDDLTTDLNIDGTVDILDLVIASNNYHANDATTNQ